MDIDIPSCERCAGNEWFGIPDSLAIACKSCGFVWVEKMEGGWVKGATLQEWADDLYETIKKRKTT